MSLLKGESFYKNIHKLKIDIIHYFRTTDLDEDGYSKNNFGLLRHQLQRY